MKRLIDLGITLLFAPLWLPLLVILSGLVYLRLGRPIFFTQSRPGLLAVPFTLIKFRSMLHRPGASPSEDEDRLTPFGRWLRTSSLDELPELINVLKGDMSLVGPRPLLMEYLPLYSARQARRHEVKPGLTGWAQVNGRNAISWDEKFELDLWYVEHQSLWLDLKILSVTLFRVFQRHGINAPGSASMPLFTGSSSTENTPPFSRDKA